MIIQENEVIMMILSLGVMAAIIINREQLKTLQNSKLLLISFIFFTLASLFTNLEAVFWPEINNILEHLSYVVSAIFISRWCFKTGRKSK
jgi:hypothetical protein